MLSKEDKNTLLKALVDVGDLTLAECVSFFATQRNKEELYFVKEAKERFSLEGELEVDDDAAVSRGDGEDADGAYVQAWVWVSKEKS